VQEYEQRLALLERERQELKHNFIRETEDLSLQVNALKRRSLQAPGSESLIRRILQGEAVETSEPVLRRLIEALDSSRRSVKLA
jgi:hypothetical protein